jgi:hypothetical protein
MPAAHDTGVVLDLKVYEPIPRTSRLFFAVAGC